MEQYAATLGYAQAAVNQVVPKSTLDRLTNQVQQAAEEARRVAYQLRAHADRLYGERPVGNDTSVAPVRCGAIGLLEDALDELSRAHAFLAEEAERNCTLA